MRVLALAVVLAVVLVVPASASTRAVEVGSAKLRDCTAKSYGSVTGVSSQSWRAGRSGHLVARLSGSDRSDFDLALFDAATRRKLAASAAFASTEVASSYVAAGQRVIVQVCRRTGRTRSARLSLGFRAMKVAPLQPNKEASIVEVAATTPAAKMALENLGLDLSDHGHDDGIHVVLHSAEDRRKLDESGYSYKTHIPSLYRQSIRDAEADRAFFSRARAAGARAAAVPSGRTSYRQYEDYQNDMKAFVQKSPSIVRALTLPKKSSEGRTIEGIEIAPNVNGVDGRPVFFIMGLHHAREWPSAEATIEFAFDLINGYGKDPRITNLLNRTRVQVFPVVNPDGFISTRKYDDSALNLPSTLTLAAAAGAGGTLSYRRKNCRSTTGVPQSAPCEAKNGVDMNRNYGARWGGPGTTPDNPFDQTYPGTGPFSEPETQAIRDHLLKTNFTNLVTNHTFTGLILRPPATQYDPPSPDEAAMKSLGDAMAAATNYISQMSFQLYDTTGGTEDYTYGGLGAYGYTPEIGRRNFHPAYSEVITEYDGKPLFDKDGNQTGKLGGLREAFLLAAEVAGDPEHHSVLEGTAPGGLKLRAKRSVTTVTSDRHPDGEPGKATQTMTDVRDNLTEVPRNGRFDWHITPSRRPYEANPTPLTVTCENDAGKVFETQRLFLERGQRLNVFFDCGGVTSARQANACELKMSRHPSKLSRTGYVRRRIVCSKDAQPFEGTLRIEGTSSKKAGAAARVVLGSRKVKLASGRRTLVKIRLSRKGRRIVRRAGRMTVSLVALQPRTKRRLARIATAKFNLKAR